MKKLLGITFLIFASVLAHAQSIPSYSADRVMQRTTNKDTVYIINFWASWCAPCVKELSVFNQLTTHYAGKPVKIILVSFDFKEAYPVKLQEFVRSRKLLPEVVWFNETDADIFIPKIDSNWHGALPTTLVISAASPFKQLWEGTVTAGPLIEYINKQLSLLN